MYCNSLPEQAEVRSIKKKIVLLSYPYASTLQYWHLPMLYATTSDKKQHGAKVEGRDASNFRQGASLLRSSQVLFLTRVEVRKIAHAGTLSATPHLIWALASFRGTGRNSDPKEQSKVSGCVWRRQRGVSLIPVSRFAHHLPVILDN